MNLTRTKKNRLKKLLTGNSLYLCMLLIPLGLSAQTGIAVKGQVTDKDGPLSGVVVLVQGTNKYAVTDDNGDYSITVSDENSVLSISYVGYKTVNEQVAGRTLINIMLEEDIATLTESVVVGYGQMKRSDLTGSVVSVSSDVITKSVVTSIDQVLNRAAGVQITQNSGMPGASTSVRIRGISSLNASNEPIYVIDGVIIDGGSSSGNNTNTNAISFVNPADIVSIDILKDASATAIYGSRASNGVIIITTKRGQKGDASVTYNGYAGWQQIPGKLDVLNLREYAIHRNTLAELGISQWNSNFVRPDLLGNGTDWQDELFTSAFMQSHNISISGGSERNTYAMTAGYLNQDGIAAGSGFKRLNLTGNFDAQVKDFLKAGINFALSNSNQKLTVSDQSLISVALRTTPDVPVRNADGSFAGTEEQFMPRNPMALASLVNNTNETTGIRGNTYLEAKIWDGLTVRTELSFNYGITNTYRFQPKYSLSSTQFADDNQGDYNKQYNKYWNWNTVATYGKTFGVHTINAMLGHEMQKSFWEFISGSRTGYIVNTGMPGLNLGDATTATNNGYPESSAIQSFFGRAFYSFDDKYLITATLRRDGSSKLPAENRWDWFPSAAVAWKISNETFFKNIDFLKHVDNAKLRLGWGLVGNQNIPDNNAFRSVYSTVTTNFGTGLLASNTPNTNIVWEKTGSYNIGLDLNLFNNRIEFIADFYYKKTQNLLLQASLPVYSGTSGTGGSARPWVNLGSLENKGFELTLSTVNLNTKDFLWRTNITFSLNRNKMLSINTQTGTDVRSIADPEGGTTTLTRTVVGQPVGQFYGYQIIGRFEKPTDFYYKDADGNIKRTPVMFDLPIDELNGVWIGDFMYADRNGDGKIDENDLTFIGNPEPKFTFGISNTFTYKNWDLTVFLTGSVGNKAVNYMRRWMENPRRNISNLFSKATRYAQTGLINPNGSDNDYRNLQITGGDSDMPRIPLSTATSDYDFAFSDRYVEDGSYLRIQNISLGYTLPSKLTGKFGVRTVKLYINLQNVYTFTDYSGYDPEIGISYSNGNQLTGVDFGRYPSPRIYTFGINITF
ncbi:MAG: TonB-dependent receptor [Prevotellaceae bacterium]|jgi:TonB-linked SusC/RagA family outer membrane protein|nr:TonB-dependent receptor [Prevotellaceae bacterium]